MRKAGTVAILICLLGAVNVTLADTIRGINIEFVNIGNPGNAANTAGNSDCGAVNYNYRIGKYEVTNAQWNAFTASAGAPAGDSVEAYDRSTYWAGAQQPANNVSWYEAAQFCNWLTSGDKSKGAYQFSGNNTNPGSFIKIDRTAAQATYGIIYFLPTENEWYKAAYFKPDGSGYSFYANGLDTFPAADDGWNYRGGAYSGPWDVGTGAQEQNGTYDMMANMYEWNESPLSYWARCMAGGCYGDTYSSNFYSYNWIRISDGPWREDYNISFRVASVIPEPATLLLVAIGGMMLRRKK